MTDDEKRSIRAEAALMPGGYGKGGGAIVISSMRHIPSMNPAATFEAIEMATANDCLSRWEHKMGPCRRGSSGRASGSFAHGLVIDGQLVGVTVTSEMISNSVTDNPHLTRDVTIELARVCACRRDVCRVLVRLWRLIVLEGLPHRYGLSYQDAALHSGDLYRFDGWQRVAFSHSGTDRRSGRPGRNKWVWVFDKQTSRA